jgi:hypothetical protein
MVVLFTFAVPVGGSVFLVGESALGSAFLTGGSLFALTEAVVEFPAAEFPVEELFPVLPQPDRAPITSRQPQAGQAGIVLREGALIDPRLARASV